MSGMPAARMLDPVVGGVIAMGSPTVLIGLTPQAAALQMAAQDGKPFCARCAAEQVAEENQEGEQNAADE